MAAVGAFLIVIPVLGCTERASRLDPLARDLPRLGSLPFEMMQHSGARLDPYASCPPAGYDPVALAVASIGRIRNVDANIPALCYTTSDGVANPCWSCHTGSRYPNLADDWELQLNYSFPETARVNRWRNLFRDRTATRARFSDAELLAYVRVDNYAPLREALAKRAFAGWVPDLDLPAGFDGEGFANDSSAWRALRYKPFLGTFWPTNGSADDVYIRLPPMFQHDERGVLSREIYKTNLAILEATIAADPRASEPELQRTIEPIDERVSRIDLDRDGQLDTATRIVGLPARYAGGAGAIEVVRNLYPAGVELAHTLRYLDPDVPTFAATRLKELRYARKRTMLDRRAIANAYARLESPDPPPFGGDPLAGMTNELGWQLQGWIEDASGWLRLQTHEETLHCMGCHTGLGVTVDQTFALARKVPGAAGWRVQDPRGIPDVPQLGSPTPEYALYLQRARGGDELRANRELIAKFFPNGSLNHEAVAATRDDIAKLVLPSRERALALNRAYLANVMEQSYIWGREAIDEPVANVRARIDERSTGIGEALLEIRDGRIWLDWMSLER